MDFLLTSRPRHSKTILSTRRKMKVLSALNGKSPKRMCNDQKNVQQDAFNQGNEIMSFLQVEQFHVEHLKKLKKSLMHPMIKENMNTFDDIIGLIDEMVATHCDLCNVLLSGKSDLSKVLKQLSSCFDAYASYAWLINLESSSFKKILDLHNDIFLESELLQEPIIYIARCKTLFQNLYQAVPQEMYYNVFKATEVTLNKVKNELYAQENTLRMLQIQRMLFKREPKILSPDREVIKEGYLYKVDRKGNVKKKIFFLFNDILLCCKVLSKTFNLQVRDSLLFCALLPLNMCTVKLIMGSSDQAALFKVSCNNMSYLLLSKIPGEAQSWFSELQIAIKRSHELNAELKPKLNRQKNTPLKQRIPPFLKQPVKTSCENNIEVTNQKTIDLQLNSEKTMLVKVKRFLACVST